MPILALGLACSAPEVPDGPLPTPRHDLAAELGVADVRLEKSRLRLADPEAREQLGEGWSYPEEDDQGTYLWAVGERASLDLFVTAVGDLELWVHGRPFVAEGAPPQEVTLSVMPGMGPAGSAGGAADGGEPPAGIRVGTVKLDPTTDRHRLPLPARALRPGLNRLVFEFAHRYRPGEWLDGVGDPRELAMQVYSFEVVGSVDAGVPRRRPATGAAEGQEGVELLGMPAGSGATWYVETRPGDRLLVRALEGSRAEALLRVDGVSGPESESTAGSESVLRAGDSASIALGAGSEDGAEGIARIEILSRPHDPWWRPFSEATEAERTLEMEVVVLSDPPGASVAGEVSSTPPGDPAPPGPALAPDTVSALDTGPDILIYLVDTLRADHLGVYGYDRPTSPNLDRFAEDAIVFTRARAQTSWTRTAVASMFSGLYPQTHGVNDRVDALPEAVRTLAEYLSEAGWETAGVVTNGNAGPKFALGQGFRVYQHLRESRQRPEVHFLADRVGAWIDTWLGGQGPRSERPPFLLYAHATDPHAPYVPREPFRSLLAANADASLGELATIRAITEGSRPAGEAEAADLRALYDAEIAFWDHHFGLTLERLKEAGLYDDMAILVISDHGEEFFEHGGWEHGRTLYDEQLRVPMVLKLPRGEGAGLRLDVDAGHVDVMPTLLELVGLPLVEEIDGRSLLSAIRAGTEAGTEGGAPMMAFLGLESRRQRSLVAGDLKLITGDGNGDRLYDLGLDPLEKEAANAHHPYRAGLLAQAIRRLELELAMRRQTADHADIDPELREQLKALGYIQ